MHSGSEEPPKSDFSARQLGMQTPSLENQRMINAQRVALVEACVVARESRHHLRQGPLWVVSKRIQHTDHFSNSLWATLHKIYQTHDVAQREFVTVVHTARVKVVLDILQYLCGRERLQQLLKCRCACQDCGGGIVQKRPTGAERRTLVHTPERGHCKAELLSYVWCVVNEHHRARRSHCLQCPFLHCSALAVWCSKEGVAYRRKLGRDERDRLVVKTPYRFKLPVNLRLHDSTDVLLAVEKQEEVGVWPGPERQWVPGHHLLVKGIKRPMIHPMLCKLWVRVIHGRVPQVAL